MDDNEAKCLPLAGISQAIGVEPLLRERGGSYFSVFRETTRAASRRTGPRSPDERKGSSFFQSGQVLKVKRPLGLGWCSLSHSGQLLRAPSGLRSLSAGNDSSPIIRFTQRFTTEILR